MITVLASCGSQHCHPYSSLSKLIKIQVLSWFSIFESFQYSYIGLLTVAHGGRTSYSEHKLKEEGLDWLYSETSSLQGQQSSGAGFQRGFIISILGGFRS